MNKSTTGSLKFSIPEWITILSVLLMLFGFLFNRVVLTLGMVLLFANALNPAKIQENWTKFKNNRFAHLCILLFLAFFVSGLWSDDKAAWWHDAQVKIPFLIMPFAMLGASFNSKKMIKTFVYIVLLSLWVGVLYSLINTIIDPSRFLAGVHLQGPVEGDYLRFTLSLVLGINLSLYLLVKEGVFLLKFEKFILGLGILIFVTYIHLQSSKLGLVAYYVLFFMFLFFYILPKKGILKALGALVVMGIALSLFLQFPSFKYQIHKVEKEKQSWTANDDKMISGSFTARTFSYKAGFNLIKNHPILGVGSGDIFSEMGNEYKKNFPEVTFNIIPHNQFIFTMATVGIPLSLTLFLMFFFPLYKNRDLFEMATVAIMLCGIMVESMLQVQFGVFVYLFYTLFWISSKQSLSNKLVQTG